MRIIAEQVTEIHRADSRLDFLLSNGRYTELFWELEKLGNAVREAQYRINNLQLQTEK